MSLKKILLLSLCLVILKFSKAQNPYESLGIKEVEVLTLSNGKYNEFFNNDTLVRIGSIMLNTITNKVVSFVDKDSIEYDTGFEPQLVSRWVTQDPLAEKYYEWSPYVYTYNNPILYIDPTGMEGIVVSGQPGGHKNKEHFLANGLDRAQAAQSRAAEGEGVTWIIYNDGSKESGHDSKMLGEYIEKAAELGITVKEVSDSDDIVDYVNNKNGDDDARGDDQVSSFYYVGHATPGDLEVGYGSGDYVEASDFDGDAFSSGAWINVVGGCRTAVDGDKPFEKSVVDQFVDKVDSKSSVHGSDVRVYYPGGVVKGNRLVKYTNASGDKINGNIVTKKGER